MDEKLAQAIHTLKTTDSAVLGGDFVILYRHGRWHLITLTYFGGQRGLHTINVMSEGRAHDMLPLLERGWLDIGGGVTTDTTWHAGFDPARAEAFIASIDKMMESGAAGLYLRFHRLNVSEALS